MADGKGMSRWWVVAGALVIQISLGAVYIWSVFQTPLKSVFRKMDRNAGHPSGPDSAGGVRAGGGIRRTDPGPPRPADRGHLGRNHSRRGYDPGEVHRAFFLRRPP